MTSDNLIIVMTSFELLLLRYFFDVNIKYMLQKFNTYIL